MSAYIDTVYLENLITAGELSGAVSYNGTPAASTGSVVAQFISASSAYVDSFVSNSGFPTPLTTVPENIKLIVAWKTYEGLMLRANRNVPQNVSDQIKTDTGYLLALSQGKISLPGVTPSNVEAAQGGHSFPNDDDEQYDGVFGNDFLKKW